MKCAQHYSDTESQGIRHRSSTYPHHLSTPMMLTVQERGLEAVVTEKLPLK